MSSDTYTATVRSAEDKKLVLRCRTGTAGGLADYAMSRSFALTVLFDLVETRGTALTAAVQELGAEVWDEDWHREHVGKFIAAASVESRRNEAIEETSPAEREQLHTFLNDVRGRSELSPAEREDVLCERFHSFVLETEVTDPKWLEGVQPGDVIGTTACDVYWEG